MDVLLAVGMLAPDFVGITDEGKQIRLSDFRGKYVVLYFYPKDDTPGCTKQACNIRDNMSKLASNDIVVLGVSTDTVESHKKFKSKYNLNFTLISDKDRKITSLYGVSGFAGLSKRVTFLIDKDGKIIHIFDNVDVNRHAEDILEKLASLSQKPSSN
ncbi:MAG: thioredoxin-dependent thiol peroxidase [Spirochaetia bacterium]|nr:thioredoxin-dependent thiol peroxidase [Spirochaetota bacterium]MCX8097375.1 thioredoxin-dependent thiol peroxidase [Spirochaetota bacterium]MDW8112276.1 thioredoxin-dependent thiol peroxidase [Spirochaetia bacterium]